MSQLKFKHGDDVLIEGIIDGECGGKSCSVMIEERSTLTRNIVYLSIPTSRIHPNPNKRRCRNCERVEMCRSVAMGIADQLLPDEYACMCKYFKKAW